MSSFLPPSAPNQLVFCPSDTALGIGIVQSLANQCVQVHFFGSDQMLSFTTRSHPPGVVRYEIGQDEQVLDRHGTSHWVLGKSDFNAELWQYHTRAGEVLVESMLRPSLKALGVEQRLQMLEEVVHPEAVRCRWMALSLIYTRLRPAYSALLGARVERLPHQLAVAAQAIERNKVRLLLADEVGLGKTVEAALIYAALRQEGRANRVLIIVPKSLQIQWLGEIYRKTHELLVLLDAGRLQDARRDHSDLSPFLAYQRMVVSIDFLLQEELLEALTMVPWDLVICDEAHRLRFDGKMHERVFFRIMQQVAAQTQHLLLLTATPMALDPSQYQATLQLLDPGWFEAAEQVEQTVAYAQRLRQAAKQLIDPHRDGVALREQLTELLSDHPQDLALLQSCASDADLLAQKDALIAALQKRHPLTRYVVRNRREVVGTLPPRHAQLQPLPLQGLQKKLIEMGEALIVDMMKDKTATRARARALGQMLRALWAAPYALLKIVEPFSADLKQALIPHVQTILDHPEQDARLQWLLGFLNAMGPQDKVLVFVETNLLVKLLREVLQQHWGKPMAWFHGQLSVRDQDRQVAYFRDPQGPQMMLSTEAGGEGRNFQFCHQMILFDLPWSPSIVEQRIGRIDRIGQHRPIHIVVPYFADGLEQAVVTMMDKAIGVFGQSWGGIDADLETLEMKLAALIIDDAPTEQWQVLFTQTQARLLQLRRQLQQQTDPLLDYASFDRNSAQALLQLEPKHFEKCTEQVVQKVSDYLGFGCEPKGGYRYGIQHAPNAAGSTQTNFIATFSRQHALLHEEIEWISFGHPLLEAVLQWAEQAEQFSVGFALVRLPHAEHSSGLALFYTLTIPDGLQAWRMGFSQPCWLLVLGEQGQRLPDVEAWLLGNEQPLQRLNIDSLRQEHLSAWQQRSRMLIGEAEKLAQSWLAEQVQRMQQYLHDAKAQSEERLGYRWHRLSSHQQQIRTQQQQQLNRDYQAAHTALGFLHYKLRLALGLRFVARMSARH